MPSDVHKPQNLTTEAIVAILGRLGLWEVPHLENVLTKSAEYQYNGIGCRISTSQNVTWHVIPLRYSYLQDEISLFLWRMLAAHSVMILPVNDPHLEGT